jgi:hypothetical protein
MRLYRMFIGVQHIYYRAFSVDTDRRQAVVDATSATVMRLAVAGSMDIFTGDWYRAENSEQPPVLCTPQEARQAFEDANRMAPREGDRVLKILKEPVRLIRA